MFESLRSHRSSGQAHENCVSTDTFSQFQKADSEARKEIGEAIEQANAMLLRTHRSLNKFFSMSSVDQMRFIGELSARTVASRRTNPRVGIGFDLYKTWLVANIEGDQEKIDRFMNAVR